MVGRFSAVFPILARLARFFSATNSDQQIDKMLPLACAELPGGVVGDGKGQASGGSGGARHLKRGRVITRRVAVYRERSLIFFHETSLRVCSFFPIRIVFAVLDNFSAGALKLGIESPLPVPETRSIFHLLAQ
jgi:hypothetical protein